jgi:FkbM family methyltransferase
MIWWRTRTSTNDGALVAGIIGSDEYELGRIGRLEGTAIDVGAHIGVVCIALAADHPGLRIIAVEPVPENVEGLRLNIEANGFGDRISVVEAAASSPKAKTAKLLWNYRSAERADQAYVDDSRYIANIFGPGGSDGDTHRVPAVSLDTLMEGLDRLALLKVDCEGCEWQFLRSPRVKDVNVIIGEFHNGGGIESLRALIGDSHEVEQIGGQEDIGVFRAVRRG